MWAICEIAKFWQNFGRFACRRCAFQQNFCNKKLGKITVLYAVKGFFHNRENKEDLINVATIVVESDERKRLECLLIINSRDRTWKITRKNTEPLPKCNHEQQPDNRMIYHMAELYTNVVHVVVDKICFTTSSTKNDVSNITFACLTKP